MYKFGETIQVRDSDENAWLDLAYVGPAMDGGVYVMYPTDEGGVEEDLYFVARAYKFHQKKPATIWIEGQEVPTPIEIVHPKGLESCRFFFRDELETKKFVAAMRALL